MSDSKVRATIRQYAGSALGWKLSGAGGGGYLVLVTKNELPGAIRLKIRRTEH
jgi:mevalonate kinase